MLCPITNCPQTTWQVDWWKVIVFIVCINRFLHFHGIYILEYKAIKAFFKSYQKIIHFPNKTESFWYFCLWVYYFCFRARRTRSFPLPEKNEKNGEFWKFGRCYRNAIYCQIEIGKLKLWEKRGRETLSQLEGLCELSWLIKGSVYWLFFVSFSKKTKALKQSRNSVLGGHAHICYQWLWTKQTYFKYFFYWNQNWL